MSDAVSSELRNDRYWNGAFRGDIVMLCSNVSEYKSVFHGETYECVVGGGAFIELDGIEGDHLYSNFEIVNKNYSGSRLY